MYVAEQAVTERKVALKVIFRHILATPKAREKFELEARVAARVQSQHIVDVLDAGIDSETQLAFIVMELLQGEPLEDIVVNKGPLPASQVALFVEQLASALSRAHGYIDRDGRPRPIVHRDLKPDNLFLTHRENGEPSLKVLDFGLAKCVSETTNVSQEVMGTPQYMAYEQVATSAITPQTDIWAMGLIAFFLLTGVSYWKGASDEDATVMGLLAEVLSLPIDPASERAAELGVGDRWPPVLDPWFAGCVERDVEQRFESAQLAATVFLGALDIARRGTPPDALDPDATVAGQPILWDVSPAPRAPALAPAPAVGAVTEAALSVTVGDGSIVLPTRSRAPLWITAALMLAVGGAAAVWLSGGGSAVTADDERGLDAAIGDPSPASSHAPHPSVAGPAPSAAPAVIYPPAPEPQEEEPPDVEPPKPEPLKSKAPKAEPSTIEQKETEAKSTVALPPAAAPAKTQKKEPSSLYRKRGQRLP